MPKNQKRIRAVDSTGRPYRGVYFYEKEDAGGRVTRTFYITYTRDGRTIEEKAGVASPRFRAAEAAALRTRRVNGEESNAERRRRLTQEAQAAEKAKDATWTMQRVFAAYMVAQGAHRDPQDQSRWQGGHKSAAQDQSRWRKHLAPVFGTKEPGEIIQLHIDTLKKATRDGGYSQSTLSNNLELLRRLLNFARDRELCPVSTVKVKLPDLDNKKTEFLTPGQIQKLMEALELEPDIHLVALVKMALLTGMRRGELFKLKWNDIDKHRGFITLRAPKGGKTQEIPMNQSVADLLEGLPRKKDSPFVFPGRAGRQRQDVSRALRRVRKNADLPGDFRMLHGLRHTFASILASSGKVDLFVLQKLMTHKSSKMTERYVHLADRTLRQAAGLAEDIILKSNPGKGENHERQISSKSLRRKH